GSDASHLGTLHGVALHVEMLLLEEASVRPRSLLLAATRNAAQLLRRDDLGVLAPGALADFLVLDANPLETVANLQRITTVVKGGEVIDRAALLVNAQ
ncbi:MAG: amidohydrolase family protein, partial [Chromatocurvus sp.]